MNAPLRRERRPRPERGAAHLPDAHRHLAARRRGTAVGPRSPAAISREGGARSEDAHELDRAERRVRAKRSSTSPTRSSSDQRRSCADFSRFQKRVAFYGFLNALSQVVLKATAPGVPDFYQGTRAVGFQPRRSRQPPAGRLRRRRSAMLKKMKAAAEKLALDRHAPPPLARQPDQDVRDLESARAARSRHAELFRDGTYEADRRRPECRRVHRRHDDDAVVVAVPRLIANLVKPGTFPIGDVWPDASLPISGSWRNLFTGENLDGRCDRAPLSVRPFSRRRSGEGVEFQITCERDKDSRRRFAPHSRGWPSSRAHRR